MNISKEMHVCKECGKLLEKDEVGIYYRLVNRAATEFLCIPHLALHFKCEEDDIHKRIIQLKNMGCTLFM